MKRQWRIGILGLTVTLLVAITLLGLAACKVKSDPVQASGESDAPVLQPIADLRYGKWYRATVYEVENQDQRCLIVIPNDASVAAMSCVEKSQ